MFQTMKIFQSGWVLSRILVSFCLSALPAPGKENSWNLDFRSTCYFASSEAEAAAQAAISEGRATAVSFALVDGDRFVQTGVFGLRDIDGEGPKAKPLAATVDTEFGIGQASKILTTLAVLKLAEQGRLRLDDPVVTHLPSFEMKSPEFRDITVRMLLGHASGLPGTDGRNLYTTWPVSGYAGQVLETVSRQHLKHEPGALRSYCNDGFTLAELVVASASGRPFTAFVKEEILEPLGMTRCGYPTSYRPTYPCARVFSGWFRQPQEFANGHGAGGFYAAPEDMAKLVRMILDQGRVRDRQLFSEASILEMGAPAFPHAFDPLPSPLTSFGLGWDTVRHPALNVAGVRAWSIRGDTPHYGSAMIVVPGEALGIFVAGAGGFTGDMATALAERTLLRALERRGRIEGMPKPPEAETLPEAPGGEDAARPCPGLYASCESAYRVSAGPLSNLLKLEWFDGTRRVWTSQAQDLRLRTDGWWSADDEPEAAYHFGDAGGRIYLAKRWASRYSKDSLILAERVTGKVPLAPFWAALRGRSWLLMNEPLDGGLFDKSALLEFLTLPGADPVLFVKGPGFHPVDTRQGPEAGGLMLRIPGYCGRDLDEPCPVSLDGELWIQYGSRVYRPLESVPVLGSGQNPIPFGDGRRLEWRRVPPGAVLSMDGFVVWKLFDGRLQCLRSGRGHAAVKTPPGMDCFLAVQGNTGAQGVVRLTAPGA